MNVSIMLLPLVLRSVLPLLLCDVQGKHFPTYRTNSLPRSLLSLIDATSAVKI